MLPQNMGAVTLYEDKVHIRDTTGERDNLPRRYTVTYSDRTADIFLSIGMEYDNEALGQAQTHERRDEVLAELADGDQPRLRVTCLVSGEGQTGRGINPAMRRRVFEGQMPFVLAIIRYGDRFFYERHPELDRASVCVEFRSSEPELHGTREYGRIGGYDVTRIAGESRRFLFVAAAATALCAGAVVYAWKRSR
jgi:hypothetical protein